MTATSHAIVGTFIAVRFTDPLISLPVAFITHYFFDIVPHWDSGTNLKGKSSRRLLLEAIIDTGIGLIVSGIIYFYIFGLDNFFYLYLVVFFALLPDIVTFGTKHVLKKKNPIWDWNNNLQTRLNKRLQLPWGILSQIIAIGLVYILLFSILI